jgi:2-hydroxychromene-2-carboxylate isomerase
VSEVIEVYFDYRSPFAYIAAQLLPELAERCDARLAWKPIDLLGLSNFSKGLPYSDKKRAYVFVDVVRSAAYHGVALRPPSPFPVESEAALRLALTAQESGDFDAVHAALFHAAWRDQQDLSSEAVLQGCAGADAERLLGAARSPAAAERLGRETEASDALGVFGVPSFVVAGELFWGIDSLPLLEWRLRGEGRA